ncbi:MAG: hypothetical protein FWH53_08935, partial [Leptospirales bacterium]|nr:hypothetical protein [Leptospirales bacterium]
RERERERERERDRAQLTHKFFSFKPTNILTRLTFNFYTLTLILTLMGLLILFGVFKPVSAFSQNNDFEDMFFFVSPRILEHGSIIDVRLGSRYAENYSWEIFFRFSKENKNEKIEGVKDSLNASNEKNYEIFLLPFERIFLKNQTSELKAGPGIYYNYNTLTEKGFFNMPELEKLTPPKEPVNSFSNDFSMHTFGPVFDVSFINRVKYFEIYSNAGIVPIFYFTAKQKMGMVPLLDPNYAKYSQKKSGSPYFYANINIILLEYLSFDFLYDFTRIKYKLIDFDDNLNWYNPSRTVRSNSLKLEAAFLIPVSESVKSKIGLGYAWSSIQLDSAKAIWNKQYYFVFNTYVNR